MRLERVTKSNEVIFVCLVRCLFLSAVQSISTLLRPVDYLCHQLATTQVSETPAFLRAIISCRRSCIGRISLFEHMISLYALSSLTIPDNYIMISTFAFI